MIKYFAIICVLGLFIGCKSPVAEYPAYPTPEGDTEGDILQPTPEEEIPFIPPSGHIGQGGETDVSIEVIDGDLHVAYSDSSKKLNISMYDDNEWLLMDAGNVFVNAGTSTPIEIVRVGDKAFIAFSEGNASGRLRLLTYNGSSWVDASEEKYLSVEAVSSISMAVIDKDLYIAHKGVTGGGTGVIVRKFNTTTSTLETLPSPASEEVSNTHLVNVDSVLNLTYVGNYGTAKAFSYDESTKSWTALVAGSAGATGGAGSIPNGWGTTALDAVSYNNVFHLIHQNSVEIKLISYENEVWTTTPGTLEKGISEVILEQFNNVMYIAYYDPSNTTLRFKKYNDTDWVDVDRSAPFLSEGKVQYVDMAYDGGMYYIAYIDLADEKKRVKIVTVE